MDIKWIQDFLALAEIGNFTRAAEMRHVSQAAFSRRIQSLETWVGAPLVEKGSYPTRLTEAGEQFKIEAHAILDRLLDTRAALRSSHAEAGSQVHIAMPSVLAHAEFSRLFDRAKGLDGATMTVTVGSVGDVVSKFVAGGADILICHYGADLPVMLEQDAYESFTLQTDGFRPYSALNTKHDFPGTKSNPVPIVTYSHAAYFARLIDGLIDRAPEKLWPHRVVQCDASDLLCDLIIKDVGIGWVPDCAIGPRTVGRVKAIDRPGWSLSLDIRAFFRSDTPTPAARRFWSRLEASIAG